MSDSNRNLARENEVRIARQNAVHKYRDTDRHRPKATRHTRQNAVHKYRDTDPKDLPDLLIRARVISISVGALAAILGTLGIVFTGGDVLVALSCAVAFPIAFFAILIAITAPYPTKEQLAADIAQEQNEAARQASRLAADQQASRLAAARQASAAASKPAKGEGMEILVTCPRCGRTQSALGFAWEGNMTLCTNCWKAYIKIPPLPRCDRYPDWVRIVKDATSAARAACAAYPDHHGACYSMKIYVKCFPTLWNESHGRRSIRPHYEIYAGQSEAAEGIATFRSVLRQNGVASADIEEESRID